MGTDLVTAKLTPEAMQLMRLICMRTYEKQYGLLFRLLRAEADRLGIKGSEA